MNKRLLTAIGALVGTWSCQTESLDIQRSFPFSIRMDAFPVHLTRNQPTAVGFGVKTDYVTDGNTYSFSWQLAAPRKATLLIDQKAVATGGRSTLRATTSALLTDSLTYIPADSGQHFLTIQVVDTQGLRKDTTFVLTVR